MPPVSSILSHDAGSGPVSSVGKSAQGNRPPQSSIMRGSGSSGATSSIFHGVQGGSQASSSVLHGSQGNYTASVSVSHSTSSDDDNSEDNAARDAIRDRLRYKNMRKVIRERQTGNLTREQSVLQKAGTGVAFNTKKFTKRLGNMVRSMKGTYKNIDKKDRKYFVGLVKPHAKSVPTGSGFGLLSRRKMKMKIEKDMQGHKINSADARSFKHLVDKLPT